MPNATPSLDTVFSEAIEITETADRADYVARACGSDEPLRRRVEALLVAHFHAGSFLEEPAGAPSDTADDAPAAREPAVGGEQEGPGTRIGPYKLLERIGEGGMGVVYVAEQTAPVRRRVALKVIKPGMDTKEVVGRFEQERQALAMMDHVNIARVLDAGATAAGLPYFVMELVHGVPITKYCDDNQLTPRERLELFVPVCQAIQHAHQKGIIHRDIKPSNVMVTLYDGKPVPKVIDFGIAKAIEQQLTERTLFTKYGTMVGTFEYMSPEQAETNALGVDTRSDIFSLGVLLYELLTGGTPLSHKRVKEAAYGEILRMIREEEAPKPSTRLSDSGEALVSISAQRHMEPAKLSKLMRGELDWIVMKTLEKDRNRRYETAKDFADDVQHYLNDEPVLACPPSAGYRLRKFARRNRRALATAAILGGVLVLAVVALAAGLVLVRAEKAEADRQRTAAEEKAARLRHRVYVADLRQGFNHWDRGDVGAVIRVLDQYLPQADQEDLPGFEWHYLDRLARAKPTNQVTFSEHKGDVYVALFSPHGNRLASAGQDGTVRLRDLGNNTSRILGRHKGGVGFLIFSGEGGTLASAGEDHEVKLWNVGTGNLIDTLRTPAVVGTVSFAPDRRSVAAAGGDGVIRLWDASTRRPLGEMKEPEMNRGHVHYIDHSPDGLWLASCDRNGRMIVWDIEKRRPRLVLQEGGRKVFCICFSPDGSLIASGGEDGLVKLWDAATGQLLTSFGQYLNQARCLHFSADGSRLAESCGNGTVRIWTVPSGALQGQFIAHTKRVWSAQFAPDGQSLVTASEDGSVKLWRLPGPGCQRVILLAGDAPRYVTFSSDGQTLAFATVHGTIGTWTRGSGSLDHPFQGVRKPLVNIDLTHQFLLNDRMLISTSPWNST